MNKGYVLLHRSLLDWEWWDDHNATRLLIYLLCAANWKDKKWRGRMIEAGSLATSWESMSNGSLLTVKQCRTAMVKLEDSGEVVRERAGSYQLVTLTKWEKLQQEPTERAGNRAGKGQLKGRERATTKEGKEREEGKYIPAREEFVNYCIEKKPDVDPQHAELKYDSWVENGWKDGFNKPILRWKAKANSLIPHLKTKDNKPRTTQRY